MVPKDRIGMGMMYMSDFMLNALFMFKNGDGKCLYPYRKVTQADVGKQRSDSLLLDIEIIYYQGMNL